MKIFSWVHRRFHHKDGGSQELKKGDHNEKVSLLEKEDLAMCDGWKEGILAIGTMGIDLSKDLNPKDDGNQVMFFGDHQDQEEEEDDQEGEMECSPLVVKASKYHHGFDHVDQKQDPIHHEVAKPNNGQEYVKDSMDLDMERLKKIKKSGERITLADLLRADSENNLLKNKSYDDDDGHINKVTKVPNTISIKKHDANDDDDDDHGSLISKKKKKFPKDDHPIKKAKQLMRKMLRKKKIHPDIGIQKMEGTGLIYRQMDHVHAT